MRRRHQLVVGAERRLAIRHEDSVDCLLRLLAATAAQQIERRFRHEETQAEPEYGRHRRHGEDVTPGILTARDSQALGSSVPGTGSVSVAPSGGNALAALEYEVDQGLDGTPQRTHNRNLGFDSVRKTGKCLVVYEDNRFGGYGAEVAAIVAEEAFDYLDGPVTRIAGPDVPGVPYNHVLEEWFMVNPEKIADGIRRLAAY